MTGGDWATHVIHRHEPPVLWTGGPPGSGAHDYASVGASEANTTDLEVAVEKALASGKTPLLLDNTDDKAVDAYYLYAAATILEAKRVVLEVRSAGVSLEAARSNLRTELVRAMRHGHTLVVHMANSAADFTHAYCADDAFPLAVFEQPLWPSDKSLQLPPQDASPFAAVLRAGDLAASGGKFHCHRDFRVVVTSTFKPDNYEKLLQGALPLQHLQPVEVFVPSEAARALALAGEGATNSGPLSGIIADWGGAWNSSAARTRGDAPKAGQLQGDRMSLFLSN